MQTYLHVLFMPQMSCQIVLHIEMGNTYTIQKTRLQPCSCERSNDVVDRKQDSGRTHHYIKPKENTMICFGKFSMLLSDFTLIS